MVDGVREEGTTASSTALGHERILLDLDTDWSSTPPINRLPIELLLRVFAACFQPARPVNDEPKRTHRRRKVLLLVCRAWRDVIEAAPDLWTFITPHMPARLFKLVLSRSKHATLDISFYRESYHYNSGLSPDLAPIDLLEGNSGAEIDDDDDEDSEPEWLVGDEEFIPATWSETAGTTIATEAHRTRTLSLFYDDERGQYSPPFLNALFRGITWPVLDNLHVDLYEVESPDACPAILRLTETHFPRLQHLLLSAMVFPIEPRMFPRFRSLHLTGPATQWPSLRDILICISSALQLEELTLCRSNDKDWFHPSQDQHHDLPPDTSLHLPLKLPHLRSLSLDANNSDDLTLLLNAFPLSPLPNALHSYDLTNNDWHQPPTNAAPLSIVDAFFPHRAPATMPLPIPRSVQDVYLCMDQRMGEWVADIAGFSANKRHPDARERLFLWRAATPKDVSSVYTLPLAIDEILTHFSDLPITGLTFVVPSLHPADGRWLEIFRAFPGLECIRVRGEGTVVPLLHALTPERARWPCPSLESLTYEVYQSSAQDAQEILRATLDCFRARAECGLPPLRHLEMGVIFDEPKQVTLAYGGDTNRDIAQLQKLVAGEVVFEWSSRR
ncbi:uncharacterized protein BXZ73DRAFT_81318 [Epithele typhae]|uniref:uncharacterized protein n=1 Tax=Epithele typhae TaxID=378194 RepID=UPI0020078B1A|nr:uncharacterized protein BXZ73DRAFT_81318 [Epithele typhae]KAH9915593.1 hypothetical protein BXZ73DRAFT_81318 [Epithele typhae]